MTAQRADAHKLRFGPVQLGSGEGVKGLSPLAGEILPKFNLCGSGSTFAAAPCFSKHKAGGCTEDQRTFLARRMRARELTKEQPTAMAPAEAAVDSPFWKKRGILPLTRASMV